jgi:hypothetical protein
MRRFTRLTNALSKKLSHLKAAVALHFAFCNFCGSIPVSTSLRLWKLELQITFGTRRPYLDNSDLDQSSNFRYDGYISVAVAFALKSLAFTADVNHAATPIGALDQHKSNRNNYDTRRNFSFPLALKLSVI